MKFFVWSDFDLDGAGSLRVLKWIYPSVSITFKTTKVSTFKDEFTNWLKTDKIENYDRVFILDLDVSQHADLVDHKNVVIIDHHLTHVKAKDVYKKAKVIVEECTSCAMLIYRKFKDKVNLTANQKILIRLVDDYDCYNLVYPESLELNYLFSDLQKGDFPTKIDRFLFEFENGFTGFNHFQKNIILFYKQKVQTAIQNAKYFEAVVRISGKERKLISAITDTAVNDVCQNMLDAGYDVAIVLNPKTNTVSFRTKQTDIDVSKLAEKLVDGGGHQYAAGGKLTEKFIEFSKLFQETSVP
jgi:nanoRNase/pAp phosphatase (c-di-AMP/oligoRNAs hydrolase)